MTDTGHRNWVMTSFARNWQRHGKLFLAIFLPLLVLALLYNVLQSPQFEATARLIVEKQDRPVLPTRNDEEGRSYADADIVDTEVEILHSPSLFRRVVDELHLQDDPEFADHSRGQTGREHAAIRLREKVRIHRAGETYLIDIIAQSADAQKAADIANAFARTYLELQAEAKRKLTGRTNDLLADRLSAMALEVEIAERRVQQFKIANDLMSVNGATLAEQSIAAIDNDLARAKAEERAAHGRLGARLGSQANLDAAQTAALNHLITEQANAEQQWRQAEQTYGQKHPRYLAARTRAEELQRAVDSETRSARAALSAERQQEISQLRSEARAATEKRVSLAKSVSGTRQSLAQTNAAQVQLNKLQRTAEAVRATYEAYLSRYQETTTQIGSEQPDARIISPATAPLKPSTPNWPLNLVLGVLLALATAFSVVTAVASLQANRSAKPGKQ